MIVADIPEASLHERLGGRGLSLRTGPFVVRVHTALPEVAEGIALLYEEHPVADDGGFADFHVSVEHGGGLRRWMRPPVLLRVDGETPFAPLPGDQGFPLLEWGLNWCVSSHCHQYLMVHAAVLERDGFALVMPAPAGSGKSTLCAGLMFHGWRLLSDELALIDPASLELVAMPRPVSLKNASIDLIRRHAPTATFSRVVHETAKGSVAHLKPPAQDVRRAAERARPGWVVLPRYEPGASVRLQALPRAEAFMHLVDNSFNYHVHGRSGFRALAALIERCDSYAFSYERLDDAVAAFAALRPPGTVRTSAGVAVPVPS